MTANETLKTRDWTVTGMDCAARATKITRAQERLPGLAVVQVGVILEIGQVVLIRPGDRIPADGTIAEGTSGIDESLVTGESMPKTKGPSDAVFAGSIDTEAALRITVTKAAEDTGL